MGHPGKLLDFWNFNTTWLYIFKNQLVKLLLLTSLITNRHWFGLQIWFMARFDYIFLWMIAILATLSKIHKKNSNSTPKTTLPCILLLVCWSSHILHGHHSIFFSLIFCLESHPFYISYVSYISLIKCMFWILVQFQWLVPNGLSYFGWWVLHMDIT